MQENLELEKGITCWPMVGILSDILRRPKHRETANSGSFALMS